jgi:hypothetical protein
MLGAALPALITTEAGMSRQNPPVRPDNDDTLHARVAVALAASERLRQQLRVSCDQARTLCDSLEERLEDAGDFGVHPRRSRTLRAAQLASGLRVCLP